MIKENNDKELSVEQKDRFSKLTTQIDQFEETSLTYGPASSNELKNRINKVIRSFDDELKSILNHKFESFWNEIRNSVKKDKKDNIISEVDIPKFLRNMTDVNGQGGKFLKRLYSLIVLILLRPTLFFKYLYDKIKK